MVIIVANKLQNPPKILYSFAVVPRVGGRGLKLANSSIVIPHSRRPPRRGTWIEILIDLPCGISSTVVPRVGGRGLKCNIIKKGPAHKCVVPRVGGRGLKYICKSHRKPLYHVVPRVGGRGLKYLTLYQ